MSLLDGLLLDFLLSSEDIELLKLKGWVFVDYYSLLSTTAKLISFKRRFGISRYKLSKTRNQPRLQSSSLYRLLGVRTSNIRHEGAVLNP